MGVALRAQARKFTVALAVGLFALTACGADKPSQDALKAKLKTEDTFKALPDGQVNCIAGVLLKYAKAGDLADYVAGKKKVEDVRGPQSKEAAVQSETAACVK
jgi:hypothetical protein